MSPSAGQEHGRWLAAGLSIWLGSMSVCDLSTRQVSNWLTLPPLGIILAWQLAHGHWQALLPLPIFYLLWRVHILGGADAKVLMALFALWPSMEFGLFFCVGYVIIALPVMLWRNRRSWRSLGTRILATLRGGLPAEAELAAHGTPAIPLYAVVAIAWGMLRWG